MNIVYKNKEKVLNENEKNGVYYLTYPMFEETGMVKHAFSTRLGGVSKGVCSTMNLSFARGDREEDVRENFRRMADVLEVEENDFVFSKQTHTTNVRVVTEKDRGKGFTKPLDYDDVDGLVTNVQGICLSTFYADCVPLFFVDPVKKAIGLSHSGWRGTVGKIGKKTVEKMQEEYGSNPKDILAAIGPSICQDCYEVSKDVIEEFKNAFAEKYWADLCYEKENGKYQLNLWKANECIFWEAGIEKEHIAVTNICTCCNSEFLFSHRASHGKRGNLAAFLTIQ
ncbi:MAG: peptidoglycan editing factor PgeF [Lachnospiraceae bacterium]|nr:peptidoglycan editing factor PgeF [Lachnospiraceae bacterium]